VSLTSEHYPSFIIAQNEYVILKIVYAHFVCEIMLTLYTSGLELSFHPLQWVMKGTKN
jgi:hypothetical protein